MITSGGNRNPAKLDRGAGAARRRGISPAFLSQPSVNATEPTDPLFTTLRAHRKIDHLNVVTSNLPPELSNAGDFSRSSIEARIHAGYEDAMNQGIGDIDAPGLQFGLTTSDVEPVAMMA